MWVWWIFELAPFEGLGSICSWDRPFWNRLRHLTTKGGNLAGVDTRQSDGNSLARICFSIVPFLEARAAGPGSVGLDACAVFASACTLGIDP